MGGQDGCVVQCVGECPVCVCVGGVRRGSGTVHATSDQYALGMLYGTVLYYDMAMATPGIATCSIDIFEVAATWHWDVIL